MAEADDDLLVIVDSEASPDEPQKISELNEKTTLADDDLLVIVDSEASPDETKKIKKSNFATNSGDMLKSVYDTEDEGAIRLTPRASSDGPEGTIFYNSSDDHVYVGTE